MRQCQLILVSDSLSLLLKTARIAVEVEIIGAFLGVFAVVYGVGVVIEVVGEVVEVEVVGFGWVVLREDEVRACVRAFPCMICDN